MSGRVTSNSRSERCNNHNLFAKTDKLTDALFIALTKSDLVEAAAAADILRVFFLTSLTGEGITMGTDGVVMVLNCFDFFKLSLNFLVLISFCFIL